MEGFKIGFGDRFMALTALIDNFQFKSFYIGSADGVGGVAITADRQFFVCLGDGWAMNTFHKLFINSVVTLGTSLCNIVMVNAGLRITRRKFMMGGMAVGAHGRHDQAAF